MSGPASWATSRDTPLGIAIAVAAHKDIGNYENIVAGRGSNRGVYVDALNTLTHAPLGSPWCAGAVAKWCDDAGADRPRTMAGSVDEWVRWAMANGQWRPAASDYRPRMGDAVVFTNGKPAPGARYRGQLDGIHIGIVGQTAPALLSIEGNTTVAGFSRDGTHVALKTIDPARVYGYIVPVPRRGGKP